MTNKLLFTPCFIMVGYRNNYLERGVFLNIILFGATGRVGTEILQLALAEGHNVTAFVRDKERLKVSDKRMTIVEGNALNEDAIRKAIPGHELVVSAMGTDGSYTLSESMPFIINEMNANDIKRIITVGTAGILQSRVSPELYRYQSTETKRRSPRAIRAAEDHRFAYEALANSSLNWTIVCPTYLPDGEKIGNYRMEVNYLPIGGEMISVPDTAQYTYEQIASAKFIKCRVGLAY